MLQKRIGNWWRLISCAIGIALLLSGCGAEKPKVYKVGIISGTDAFLAIADGFKSKMAELGYVEGKNVVYDMQQLNADPAGELQVVKKFVADKVDLIFAYPTETTEAAQAATQGTNIPVVFAYAGIEGSDLVESVRRPGGNITGVRFPGPDLISKRLEIMLDIAPGVKRVWIGYDKNYTNTAPALEVLRPLAASKGVTLVETPATSIEEIKADLAKREQAADIGLDAIILMPDTFNHSPEGWEQILTFATKHHVPIGGSFFYTVQQGAVFGNANDLFKVGELAAPIADKILKGTPPGEIPVVTPEPTLWINYKVAVELGLTVPEDLLSQAVEIIR